jgi:hypothetical protein
MMPAAPKRHASKRHGEKTSYEYLQHDNSQ